MSKQTKFVYIDEGAAFCEGDTVFLRVEQLRAMIDAGLISPDQFVSEETRPGHYPGPRGAPSLSVAAIDVCNYGPGHPFSISEFGSAQPEAWRKVRRKRLALHV